IRKLFVELISGIAQIFWDGLLAIHASIFASCSTCCQGIITSKLQAVEYPITFFNNPCIHKHLMLVFSTVCEIRAPTCSYILSATFIDLMGQWLTIAKYTRQKLCSP